MGIRDRPTAPRSPWQNGYCERAIGSIRRECLDHVVVFGERHLRHLLRSYATYRARPLFRQRTPAMRRDIRRDLRRCRLAVCTKVGSLFRDYVHASEWRIGLRLSPAEQHRSHGRVALPLLTVGGDRSVGVLRTAALTRITCEPSTPRGRVPVRSQRN
jgi:Integrase core domain